MDNYKLIQFTDNKILFFIVIKITILPSTLYVIVLLYLKHLILMWPMSSKYVIYRVTSNFTFHQNMDVYDIVFWLRLGSNISLVLWIYDGKTSWQNSKDLMGERRCGWKTHITKKERLIIWCLDERHNTELRKGITHLARNECIIYWKIFYQILFSTKDVNYVLTLETKIIQKPTIWFELRNYVQVQNRKDMVNII